MFTWIPIHREATHRILKHRQNQGELLAILREMEQQGLKVISLEDKDIGGQTIPLAEIDPFSFLATFNRGVTDKNRRDNWAFLKSRWNLKAAVPEDFTGIPVLHNMTSRLLPYAKDREKDHVGLLWQLAGLAADGGVEQVDAALFNRCVELPTVGIRRLTICLFWIQPEKFLSADSKNTAYGKSKGITTEPEDFQSYRQWLSEMTEQLGSNYPEVSHEAHLFAMQTQSTLDLTQARMQTLWGRFHKVIKGFTDFQNPGQYFLNNETGYKRAILKKFQQELGAERLSALVAQRQGAKAAKDIVRVLTSNLVSFHSWNITLGKTDQAICDVVQACLKATSAPYQGPESTRDLFDAFVRHNLKPSWDALTVLLWALRPQDFFPVKISFYRGLSAELGHELPSGRPDADKLHTLIEFGRAFWEALEPQKPTDWVDVQSFIWCVCPGNYEGPAEGEGDGGALYEPSTQPPAESASRYYWTLSAGAGGEHWDEFYEKGIAAIGWDGTPNLRDFRSKEELRQKLLELWPGDSSKKNDALACWQFAHDIEVGDIIFAKQGFTKLLGYGLVEGDYEFDAKRESYRHVRKVRWLAKGEWELPEESKMASKTLTDITPYPHFVRVLADKVGLETAAAPKPADAVPLASSGVASWWLNANPESFDKRKAMKGLFLAESQFDEMLAALREKKNVVLQGAPGVGKTYVARRLAYALIASNDPQRIEIIQFHQSYSYEDFIQGFRPTPKGHFDLKYGIFYQFCRRAQRDEGRPYVFIIDEINRGNLSKIFGELMMLIEADKRGKEHAIPLAYSQDADEKFYIPENLHLIGMMNTADRSLAMVDYALRRRFRFITLRPEFSSEAFQGMLADAGAEPELVKKIVGRMTALNDIIAADTKNLGPGYQIGHSFFCPRNGIQPDNDWYRRVIESEITPLIQEYWFDNEQKVRDQRMALLA